MKMLIQKPLIYFLISVTLAIILSISLTSNSVDEQLINLSAEQDLPYLSLDNEPAETKAILLDYADNQELVLSAWLALKKYPKTAGQVFLLYGEEAEFKKALLQFGDGVIPVVDYFLKNEVASLTAQETAGNLWQSLQNAVSSTDTEPPKTIVAELTPQQRGWYAVNYINQDGYDFLGQFALDKNGNTQWIQSDRTTKALVSLFTSGIRDLETKYKTDEEITKGDILWASVDVFALASSLKLLKASRAVSSSKLAAKPLSLSQKTSVFSSKLIKNKTVQGVLKYTAIGTTAYIAIAHPSLINSLLNEAAQLLGMSPMLLKVLAWSAIIFVLLHPLLLVFNSVVKPLLWIARKAA